VGAVGGVMESTPREEKSFNSHEGRVRWSTPSHWFTCIEGSRGARQVDGVTPTSLVLLKYFLTVTKF
jgi:hypothetical protein